MDNNMDNNFIKNYTIRERSGNINTQNKIIVFYIF